MWFKWFPWRYLLRRLARAHGFIDPIALLTRLAQFAQPAEVLLPLELLRFGVIFHARGLCNAQVIQQNLDWLWPYWVQRQYDPQNEAFIPRGFSITHVNLTHRNWTAIGIPGCAALPIVDPRGLVTPYYDGWSIDAWIATDNGQDLIPARLPQVQQQLVLETTRLAVRTLSGDTHCRLSVDASVQLNHAEPQCCVQVQAEAASSAWLALALRPCNPEGVSGIYQVHLDTDRQTWHIDKVPAITFSVPVERHVTSHYRHGDVSLGLLERRETTAVSCHVGMATAAALFRLAPGQPRALALHIPLSHDPQVPTLFPSGVSPVGWAEVLRPMCRVHLPDVHTQFLYDAAIRTLILHTPHEAYPGPYTYKRFWFRDAAFIVQALLCAGLRQNAETVLDTFPERQTKTGFFYSQDGEWDANGQALWSFQRFCALTGAIPKPAWQQAIVQGARWLLRKRTAAGTHSLHAGLLPAGFSAEHLGTNDYYYWDDFWGVAGLEAAATLCAAWGDTQQAHTFATSADDFMQAIAQSLHCSQHIRQHPGLPASPYRRMDAGAIGSLVASYPLRLWPAQEARLLHTVAFLQQRCFRHGVFFQEMFHSGLNAYLTLHIAQVLLRAGEPCFGDLVRSVSALASPTGQWPEAIHPRTRGGCMGDGQHVWAAAEWVVMIRNMFVREEDDGLVLASGLLREWLEAGVPFDFGPAPTPYGDLHLRIEPAATAITVTWQAHWRCQPPRLTVALPGLEPVVVDSARTSSITISLTQKGT
jgi:hypothetical protein